MNVRRVSSILFAVLIGTGPLGDVFGQNEQTPKIVTRIPREPVASTAIAAIGYSKRLHILDIEFRNGAIYRYADVPRSVYQALMKADSKAHYFDEQIKGKFTSTRIRRWHTGKQ